LALTILHRLRSFLGEPTCDLFSFTLTRDL
jgi:hypothetical protein